MMITAVIIGFSSMILVTFEKTSITSDLLRKIQAVPSRYDFDLGKDNFLINLNIQLVDLSYINLIDGPQYFDISLHQYYIVDGYESYTATPIPLERCTPDHWPKTKDFVGKAKLSEEKNWACPKLGQKLQISGSYESHSHIRISGHHCRSMQKHNIKRG